MSLLSDAGRRWSFDPWPRRVLGLLCALIAILTATPLARAQGGFGELPSVSRDNVESYARMLGLREDQQEAVFLLHEGYEQAIARARGEWRDRSNEIVRQFENTDSDHMDPRFMQERVEKMATLGVEYFHRLLDLQEGLFGDMRAMLDEEQAAHWARVERKRRRDLVLEEFMDLSWSQVDLVDSLESIGIEDDGLMEAVTRYEIDADRPLRRIYALILEGIDEMPELMARRDEARIREIQGKASEAMKEMRAINKRHARLIAVLLAPADRARFEAEVRDRAFPMVFGPMMSQPAFEVAFGLDDLTTEQREAIDALRGRYREELARVNAAWAAAIDERDETFDFSTGERRFESPGTPVFEAREARMAVDRDFDGRLRAILTGEQIERLRDRPANPGG